MTREATPAGEHAGAPAWRRPLLIALYLVGVVLVADCSFMENDNVRIHDSIKSGASIRYIGFLFTRLLHSLYAHVSATIPWYGLAIYAAHFASLWLFFGFAERAFRSVAVRRAVGLLYLLAYTPLLVKVGYNGASILLGASVILRLVSVLDARKASRIGLVGLGLLFVFAFELRNKGALAALVFVGPVVAYACCREPRRRVALVLWAVVPAAGVMLADSALYRRSIGEVERSYLEFNGLRGRLHGFPILEENHGNVALLEANGWTPNDYELFANWFFIHEDLYNSETLRNIFELSVPIEVDFADVATKLRENALVFEVQLGVLAGLFLAGLVGRRRLSRWGSALYFTYVLALFVYMSVVLRFPMRIGMPLLLASEGALAFLVLGGAGFQMPRRRWGAIAASVVLALTAGLTLQQGTVDTIDYVRRSWKRRVQFDEDIAALESAGKDSIFVFKAGTMAWERQDPLREYELGFQTVRTGWNTYSPGFYKSLQPLGIEQAKDLIPVLVNDPDAFFVCRQTFPRFVRRFIEDNYEVEATFYPVGSLHSRALIYRILSKDRLRESFQEDD